MKCVVLMCRVNYGRTFVSVRVLQAFFFNLQNLTSIS